jgi:hypothetical protein
MSLRQRRQEVRSLSQRLPIIPTEREPGLYCRAELDFRHLGDRETLQKPAGERVLEANQSCRLVTASLPQRATWP